MYPALMNLFAHWAPPAEKGKFMSALMGGSFGIMCTFPLCSLIMESFGWTWAFYATGLMTALAAILWLYIVTDTPRKHPRMSDKEKDYIEESFKGTVTTKKAALAPFPLKGVLKSPPFWSLVFLHFGCDWGDFFFSAETPTFINEVLGFNLHESGFLSALPYLAMVSFTILFGPALDVVVKSGRSISAIRKILCIFCKCHEIFDSPVLTNLSSSPRYSWPPVGAPEHGLCGHPPVLVCGNHHTVPGLDLHMFVHQPAEQSGPGPQLCWNPLLDY